MEWRKASRKFVGERSWLQRVFNRWDERHSDVATAGAPPWLSGTKGKRERRAFRTTLGHEFTPDVLWIGEKETLLIELKAALKYEPLAIPEVLHHQHMLADERYVKDVPAGLRRDAIVPVIVAQYHPWTRAALAQLRKEEWDTAALRYLEFDLVNRGAQEVLWFDDPFAPWAHSEPPTQVPPGRQGDYKFWYRVEDHNTWFGVTEQQDERPVFILGPQINVTRVADTNGSLFVAWEGELGKPGTYWIGGPG